MRVVSITNEEEAICQFLTAPLTRTFKIRDLRFLTNKERQPIRLEEIDYKKLIDKRNIAVSLTTIKKPSKAKRTLTPKERMLREIKKAPISEVKNIMKRYGF